MDAEVEYHEDTRIDKMEAEFDRRLVDPHKIRLGGTTMSGHVDKLFAAMAKAQGEMGNAAKTEENSFYGSKYADLSACFEAVRQPLFMNGLCVIQSPSSDLGYEDHDEKYPAHVTLNTLIGHTSGQWVVSTLSMPLSREDAHGVGSAVTYARRYALASMLGLAQADDDGNAATIPAEAPAKKKPAKKATKKKAAENGEPKIRHLGRLNDLLKEVGCSNTEEADLVCAWLFDDHSLTVDMCRESETSSQAFSARVDEVVATGISLDEFLTRAAVWRDGTQEEATT
jgi:hypothetical protein